MNAGELPEMDPYEEVTQQGHAHPLSPAYVSDPMELVEHVSVYVLEPEHPKYHAPSDDDIKVEDGDEDPEEDPCEEHEPEDDDEDPEEDPNEEHEPEDEDTKESSEGSDETEPFVEDETSVTPPPPRHRGDRISVRPQTPMAASTHALIDAFAAGSSPFPLPPTIPAYDQAPLVESSAATARAPRSRYNFVDTVKAGQGFIHSPSHDAQTIARAADRAEGVGYVRRQESANFYTQLLDARTDRIDISLGIDVVRSQRTSYETELQECQSTADPAVAQMMRIHALEVRARTNTVEDVGSSC
uniref:Uncharacterized protein n=1 Tax=Tanacetum cinerariifolium TaxID=118510 RepID=A0A699HBX3_TANCI|nr:hypothetical protein [Tanacetum cinerariifolium]